MLETNPARAARCVCAVCLSREAWWSVKEEDGVLCVAKKQTKENVTACL